MTVAGDENSEAFALSAFRRHRHDVMNSLQLVKSYTQINKPDAALRWLDQLAEWLQMISRCQAQLSGSAATIIWQLAQSPHVRLDCKTPLTLTDAEVQELLSLISRLETFAGQADTLCTVRLYSSDRDDSMRLTCEIMQTEAGRDFGLEIEPWRHELRAIHVISGVNEE